MAGNRRLDPVSYRPFRAQPLLSEGLLSVSREGGGEIERKVAAGLARMAGEAGQVADRQAAREGMLAGQQAAMDGAAKQVTVTGGQSGPYRVYTGSGIDQAKALLREEEAFRDSPYWDVTAHRVGYGSDTTIGPDGRPVKVTPGMKITRDQAERDLDYRLSQREGAQVRKQLGAAFDSLPAPAQAALLSVGYNYGSLPDSVVAAGRTGNLGAIADAVAGLSANPKRRQREAAMIRSGGSPAGAPVAGAASGAAADGPISVRSEASSFRPTGRDTIYGRAYDVAGTKTYLQDLSFTMRQEQDAVYEAYKDNPAMLERALGELEQAHLRDHVFPEISAEYRDDFRRLARANIDRANKEMERRVAERDRADFLNRVTTLEEQRAQAVARAAAGDDGANLVLAKLQADLDSHYDSAVNRGVMTADQAQDAKQKGARENAANFYLLQANGKTPEEIAAMRGELRERWSRGEEPDLDADAVDKVERGLTAAENARRTQDNKANMDLAKRGDDLARRVAQGLPVSAEELAKFQLDAGTAPKGREIAASTMTKLRISEAIRNQPIGAVEKNIRTLIGENAAPDDIEWAQKQIAAHKKDLTSDPLGVAERFGVLPVSPGLPLDGDVTPDAVAGAFAERLNAARAAADHFGVQPQYFRPGEAKAIEEAVKADPERGLDIAAGLVDAAGPDADRVLQQLGRAAPAVSLAGGIVAMGGDRQAALDLIAGMGKTPDGKNYTDIPNTKRMPMAQAQAGQALVFTPSEVNRLDTAAAAIARKRIYDAGLDPKKDDVADIYERAYHEAAGATYVGETRYGGFADYDRGMLYRARKVLLPPSVRADKFEDLMGALADTDLGGVTAKNGRAWTAKDFQKAMPVAVKGGFVFALGDLDSAQPMFIADDKGDPIVLDLDQMRPMLEPRVPGAYR